MNTSSLLAFIHMQMSKPLKMLLLKEKCGSQRWPNLKIWIIERLSTMAAYLLWNPRSAWLMSGIIFITLLSEVSFVSLNVRLWHGNCYSWLCGRVALLYSAVFFFIPFPIASVCFLSYLFVNEIWVDLLSPPIVFSEKGLQYLLDTLWLP